MADSVLGSTLITTCRQYGEIEEDYWSDAKVLQAINDAAKELWDRILSEPGGRELLLTKSSDLTVTAGTATVSLPADVGVEVHLVEVKWDTADYRPLRTFNLPERSDETVVAQSDKLNTCYRIVKDTILLSPTPNWSGSILT